MPEIQRIITRLRLPADVCDTMASTQHTVVAEALAQAPGNQHKAAVGEFGRAQLLHLVELRAAGDELFARRHRWHAAGQWIHAWHHKCGPASLALSR